MGVRLVGGSVGRRFSREGRAEQDPQGETGSGEDQQLPDGRGCECGSCAELDQQSGQQMGHAGQCLLENGLGLSLGQPWSCSLGAELQPGLWLAVGGGLCWVGSLFPSCCPLRPAVALCSSPDLAL